MKLIETQKPYTKHPEVMGGYVILSEISKGGNGYYYPLVYVREDCLRYLMHNVEYPGVIGEDYMVVREITTVLNGNNYILDDAPIGTIDVPLTDVFEYDSIPNNALDDWYTLEDFNPEGYFPLVCPALSVRGNYQYKYMCYHISEELAKSTTEIIDRAIKEEKESNKTIFPIQYTYNDDDMLPF